MITTPRVERESSNTRQISGLRPRLGLASSLSLRFAMEGLSFLRCTSLFRPNAFFNAVRLYRERGLSSERLGPLIHQQSANPGQGAVELVNNAIEAATGLKMIGRFGEGRIQNFKMIVGDPNASMEISTKNQADRGRRISFFGIKNENNDVELELGDSERITNGTEVRINRKLTTGEQNEIIAALSKLKYFQRIGIRVNGRLINDNLNIGQVSGERLPPQGEIEVTVGPDGFTVSDHGPGMTAETLIKKYLVIGNSDGEHQRKYDNEKFPPNLYFQIDRPANAKKGKIQILLFGCAIQEVVIDGIGIDEELGLEMGSGLSRNEGSDKVVMGRNEVEQLIVAIKDLMKMEGLRKWQLLNTLMTAVEKIDFDNGLRNEFIDAVYREIRTEVQRTEILEKVVFVPNKNGFEGLLTERQKVFLDERLFDFNPEAAGLTEHQNYESVNGHKLYLGKFESRFTVYRQVGKAIILNERYQNNLVWLNLLFNFYPGYGEREAGKVKIRLPIKTPQQIDALPEVQTGRKNLASSETDPIMGSLIRSGKTRTEAVAIIAELNIRLAAAREQGINLKLQELLSSPVSLSNLDDAHLYAMSSFLNLTALNLSGNIKSETSKEFEFQKPVIPPIGIEYCRDRIFIIKNGKQVYELLGNGQLKYLVFANLRGDTSISIFWHMGKILFIDSSDRERLDVYKQMKLETSMRMPSVGSYVEEPDGTIRKLTGGEIVAWSLKALLYYNKFLGRRVFIEKHALTLVSGDYAPERKFGLFVESSSTGEKSYLIDQLDYFPTIRRSGGRTFVEANKNGGKILFEIVFDESSKPYAVCLFEDTIKRSTNIGNNYVYYRPEKIGPNINRPIPTDLPEERRWFSDESERKLCNNRRLKMEKRILLGDYDPDLKLELFGYLSHAMVERMGEVAARGLERKLEKYKSVESRELFFIFIEKLWEESQGNISQKDFTRAIERWDYVFENFLDEQTELQDLLENFEVYHLYRFLFDGRQLQAAEEIRDWVKLFREEDLEAASEREAYLRPPTNNSLVLEHDLGLYAWAARIHSGWEKTGIDGFRAMLTRFSQLIDLSPIRKRLRGIILGQELERFSYIRELAQNSIDAGSDRLEIQTRIRNNGNRVEHVAEFRDFGTGMTGEQVRGALLNIDREKEGGEGQELIGGFGIGFKSVFKEASRVRVLTRTKGSKAIIEVELRCLKNQDGMFDRVVVEGYREQEGEMVGTAVEVIQDVGERGSGLTDVRAMLLKNSYGRRIRKFVGLVRAMGISHNGNKINEEIVSEESLIEGNQGTYRLLESSGQKSPLVNNGLWIRDNFDHYLSNMPEILREYAEGCALEIGEHEIMTRGRGGFFAKEQEVSKMLFILLLKRAVKFHLQGNRIIKGLPGDYYGLQNLRLIYPKEVLIDAAAINEGRIKEVDFIKYQGDGQKELVKLLALIEVEGNDGVRLSVNELGRHPELMRSELVGKAFSEIRSQQLEIASKLTKAKKTERILRESELSPVHKELLSEILETLEIMAGQPIDARFFSNPDKGSAAGYALWFEVFLKIEQFEEARTMQVLEKIKNHRVDQDVLDFYQRLAEVVSHEATHVINHKTDDWTHGADPRIDKSFPRNMINNIETMIIAEYDPLHLTA